MIDIGERAVLSVLVQRGGKLPEWKRVNGALRIMETGGDGELLADHAFVQEPACIVRQFNSATIADLVGRGYARRRVDRVRRVRIVEITDKGRAALENYRDPLDDSGSARA